MPKKKLAKLTTGRRHMTKEQRDQCVRLYQDGFSLKFLADFYNRHESIINRLIGRHGVRRGHVSRKMAVRVLLMHKNGKPVVEFNAETGEVKNG